MSTAILLLEDSNLDAELLGEFLQRAGLPHSLDRVSTGEEFRQALRRQSYDLILSDYQLPGFDGPDALRLAREAAPDTPFIFVSGFIGEDTAVETLRLGATDYVLKNRLARLPLAIGRALAEAQERKERREAERRQALLMQELNHRVKNILATVLSLARQSLKEEVPIEAARRTFEDRLAALSKTHDLLTQGHWEGAELRRAIEVEIAPYCGERLRRCAVRGPAVHLLPSAVQTLGLVFHELATNAAKYGALSVPDGGVDISWTVSDGGRHLALVWAESGGPPVTAPTRQGFGSRLISRGTQELGGQARMLFEPTGLRCHVDIPIDRLSVRLLE